LVLTIEANYMYLRVGLEPALPNRFDSGLANGASKLPSVCSNYECEVHRRCCPGAATKEFRVLLPRSDCNQWEAKCRMTGFRGESMDGVHDLVRLCGNNVALEKGANELFRASTFHTPVATGDFSGRARARIREGTCEKGNET